MFHTGRDSNKSVPYSLMLKFNSVINQNFPSKQISLTFNIYILQSAKSNAHRNTLKCSCSECSLRQHMQNLKSLPMISPNQLSIHAICPIKPENIIQLTAKAIRQLCRQYITERNVKKETRRLRIRSP